MRSTKHFPIRMMLVVVFLLATGIVSAQNVNYAGTSVANFLKVGVGARAVGMGDSYITESADAISMYWNPGAISRIEGGSAVFSSMPWLVDTQIFYAGFTIPSSMGTFGFDFHRFSSGDMEETTLQEQEGTGRFFDAGDLQLGLAYCRSLTDRFSFGMKIKYLQEELAHVKAQAFGFDIGSLFYTSFLGGLKLGMTLSNFGSKMTFSGRDLAVIYPVPSSPSNKEVPAKLSTESWEIPLFFRVGVSFYALNSDRLQVMLAGTVVDGRDRQAHFNFGTEVGILNMLYLRGGYRIDSSDLPEEHRQEATYSLGLGLDLGFVGVNGLKFDYSLLDYGRFEMIEQFTMAVGF